jgi:hypothetical protein
MPDFLPRRDAELLSWSSAFDSNIHADPEAFGLSADQAAEYRTLHVAFAEAYRAAVAPGERTGPALVTKDAARVAVKNRARELAKIVKSRPQVTRTQWAVLGLRGPQGGRRVADPEPASRPVVVLHQLGGARIRVTLRDLESTTRKAKPKGVGKALLYHFAGENPPADRMKWGYLRGTTRTSVDVTIPGRLPAGTRIWISAQWSTRTGRRGPTSDPSMTWIAGEVPMAA